MFVPECDTEGAYQSTQCHESSGFCWCVDAGGNEIPRTRIRGRAMCKPSGKVSILWESCSCVLPTTLLKRAVEADI